MKKKILFILLGIVILGGIYGLYSTFALTSTSTGSTSYTFDVSSYTVGGATSIVIPANTHKQIVYRINNPNNGTLEYGVVYSLVYSSDGSADTTTGAVHSGAVTGFSAPSGDTIDKDENKFIFIEIDATATTERILKLKTVFGYANGGDLVIPDGYTLLS